MLKFLWLPSHEHSNKTVPASYALSLQTVPDTWHFGAFHSMHSFIQVMVFPEEGPQYFYPLMVVP